VKTIPLLAKEGWLFQATDYCGNLKQPPRPLHKGCFAAFSLGRVHPSFAKEGYMLPQVLLRKRHRQTVESYDQQLSFGFQHFCNAHCSTIAMQTTGSLQQSLRFANLGCGSLDDQQQPAVLQAGFVLTNVIR